MRDPISGRNIKGSGGSFDPATGRNVANTPLPHLDDATLLAVERTRVAHDRTLLAWVRTSVSLISFGFTIYKFFQYLRDSSGNAASNPAGPRRFGLSMILIGLVALVLATIQYRGDIAKLAARYGPQPRSLTAALSALVGVLGIVGLAFVYFRL